MILILLILLVIRQKNTKYLDFLIGNFSAKFKSDLKDIHLAFFPFAAIVSKYGYKTMLAPLLDDMKKLETEGIQVMVKVSSTIFLVI